MGEIGQILGQENCEIPEVFGQIAPSVFNYWFHFKENENGHPRCCLYWYD